MNAHIYCVTNMVNGKQYVGQTTVDKNKLGHGNAISAAYHKYGKSKFSYVKVSTRITTRNSLNYLERFWISVYSTMFPNGYNLELGGTDKGEVAQSTKLKLRHAQLGRKLSPETKLKIKLANVGEKNAFFGKQHTPEVIAKLSAINTGKTHITSEETKDKIRKANSGINHPMYGKPITAEHRAKLVANNARNKPWLGKKMSNSHKAHHSIERTCPHCGKIGKGTAMLRYHMNNCKENINMDTNETPTGSRLVVN